MNGKEKEIPASVPVWTMHEADASSVSSTISHQQVMPFLPTYYYPQIMLLPGRMPFVPMLNASAAPQRGPIPTRFDTPLRTLFVRNVYFYSKDSDIIALFAKFGDIRNFSSQNKLTKGFVFLSYYDLRSAVAARTELQGRILDKRRLDIHFSHPKTSAKPDASWSGRPSSLQFDASCIEGAVVCFNLDPLTSDQEVIALFQLHGDVKQVRSKENKRQCRFVEYFDVRACGPAIAALTGTSFNGKIISVEKSAYKKGS